MVTPKDVDFSDTWLNVKSNMGASDQLPDLFSIVIDQHKRQKMNTPGSIPMKNNIPVLSPKGYNSPGDNLPPSQHN